MVVLSRYYRFDRIYNRMVNNKRFFNAAKVAAHSKMYNFPLKRKILVQVA